MEVLEKYLYYDGLWKAPACIFFQPYMYMLGSGKMIYTKDVRSNCRKADVLKVYKFYMTVTQYLKSGSKILESESSSQLNKLNSNHMFLNWTRNNILYSTVGLNSPYSKG